MSVHFICLIFFIPVYVMQGCDAILQFASNQIMKLLFLSKIKYIYNFY